MKTFKFKWLLLSIILSIASINTSWAWTTYYLKSDNTTWAKDNYNWGFSNGGTTTTYMANGSNIKLWRTDWGDNGWFGVNSGSISDNGSGIRFEQYGGNVSYTGSSGMVCFHMDQETGNNNDHPWVWITRPTWYLKHNWNNGSWIWYTLTDNQDGTYKVNGQYGGQTTVNHGDNGNDGGSGWGSITASTVGSPQTGDQCRFTFNASNMSVTITKLYVVSFNMKGHGSAIDNQYIYPGETASTPSTPSATGYTFGGWYTDEGCTSSYSFSTAVNANRTLYAKWTANSYDVVLNVNGGSGSNQTVTATYDAAMPTTLKGGSTPIAARTRTGYTFGGYFRNSNGTGTQYYKADLTSNHVWDVATNNTPIYAKWTAKNYTVTFNNNGGSEAPTSKSVTYDASPGSVTIFPTKTNYAFDGYYTSGGVKVINKDGTWVSGVDGYTNGSGKWIGTSDKTLYAHWLEVGYYMVGAFTGGDWNAIAANKFDNTTKKCTITVANHNIYSGASYLSEFKICHVQANTSAALNETLYGKDATIGKGNPSVSGLTSGAYVAAIKEQLYYDGDYVFTLTTSPSLGVTVAVPVIDQLQIYNSDPSGAIGIANHDWSGPTSDIVTKTVTLARNTTYQFKAVYDSEYYGYGTGGTYKTLGRGTDSTLLATSTNNVKIATDVKGNYKFDFQIKTHKVKVTFPTRRLVTYSIVTKNGGSGASGSLTVTNDDDGNVNISTLSNYVADGNKVTFAAPAAKTGYTWRGWFNKNNPSNWEDGLLSSNATYSNVTISGGDKTVYAIYSQDDYTVAVVAGAGGSVASESVSAHYDNKVTLPTATPDAGYYFTGWEKTEGTATLYSTSSASAAQIDGVTSSNTVTVRANFHADDEIYFDNTYTKWSKVYVYLFNNNVWYDNKEGDDGPGVKPNHSNRVAFAEMTKVKGTTNLYEFAYHTSSVNYTFSHVAFCKDNQSTYNAFYNTDAVYRNDWDDKLRVYVAPAGYTTPLINGTKYHGDKNNNAGYWRVYNPKAGDNAYYYLDQFCAHGSTFPDGQYFKASGDGALVAEISARLTSASTDYSFGVHSAGTTNLHFATSHTFTVDDSEDIKLYKYNSDWNFTLKTTSEGIYTFVLSMEHDSLRLSVIYPASVNDYRIKFTENGKSHYSDIIKKKTADAGVVTTSMYINKDGTSPSLKLEQCTSITAGVPTWTERKDFGFTGFGSKGVYVMDLTVSGTNGISSTLSNISAYSGPYYIKTDGASGGWQNYKQNVMDENSLNFDAEHPDKSFNYYYCKYYNSAGTNLKCVIANDYCNALTDTLKGDAVIGVGNQTTPSAANVRFSYNSYTNEINRSYLGSSVASDFLRILGNTTAGQPHIYAKDEGSPGDATAKEYIKFEDKQNWRYEIDVKANINARAKLTAAFNGQTQYFWGAAGDFSVANTELLFGGSGSGIYGLTLVYDFKTNKLITAWKPTGTISDDLTLNSDIILLREHQGTPTTITFGLKDEEDPSSYASLSEVKTVYSVLRFNRWKLSNRAHPEDLDTRHCDDGVSDYNTYHRQLEVNQDDENGKWLPQAERELYFISFPFDVKMSDIIHFGGYYNTWGIMYYDGKGRAKNGYWIDSESNWKYFTPEEFATGTLKAYEGYIIGIDLAIMAYNNTSFWTNNSSEVDIYFPSKTAVSTITQQTVTVKIDTVGYECTINRTVGGDDGDRRIKDSHWHCIGVPAYASVSQTTHTNEPDKNTNWKTDNMLYVYSWRPSTNDHVIADAGTFTFNAMYAYLVQYAGTTLSWAAAAVSPSSIAARRMKTEEMRDRQFNLQLLQDEKEADHTYIRLSDDEEVTTGFEFNHDVSKMMLSGANIYTLIGKEQAAANSLPLNLEQTTIVPVGVKIATNGDYTFSISEGTQGVGVTLIDNETGSRTNLSALDYEISLEAGTYDERFMLEISPIMHTPTSVEGITGDESHVTNARKVMIDGLLYIVKDGVIYDARGAVVK